MSGVSPRTRFPLIRHILTTLIVAGSLFNLAAANCALVEVITVGDLESLQSALATVKPGTTISILPGRYPGGLFAQDVKGEPGRPIVLQASDPKNPPVFEGGSLGLQFSRVAYLELRDLMIRNVTGNGLNIDDGGQLDRPSHHVILAGLKVSDIGPEGNRDGIKLSGLDDFEVRDCVVERWGSGGSGIDMVGCHRGMVAGCTFRHEGGRGDNGVQTKGGSSSITIQRCRFENAGQRSINVGGSTGLSFFRPRPQGHEAKDITVEDCTIIGSTAPVAFVGVDGASFHHNTLYRPGKYALRILQETREPGFVPSRRGQFTDNVIAFHSDEMVLPINVGPGTEPASFTLARNAWYCLDQPARSQPRLELPESGGIYGQAPHFVDPEQGDFRLGPDSPLGHLGPRSVAP